MGVPLQDEESAAILSPRKYGALGTNGDLLQPSLDVDRTFFKAAEYKEVAPRSRCWTRSIFGLSLICLAAAAVYAMVSMRQRDWDEKHPDENVPFELVSHPSPPRPELWGDSKRPFPTGAFWLNAGVEQGDQPVVAYPYALSFVGEGVHISYSASRRYQSPRAVADIFASDIKVTSHERTLNKTVALWDAFSMTERYLTATGGFEVIAFKGSPYITLELDNVSPIFTPLATFTAVNGTQASPFSSELNGTHFKFETTTGQVWLLFASEQLSLGFSNVQMWAKKPYTGTLRLALLPSPEDEVVLKEHSRAYPVGGGVGYSVSGDSVDMTYSWEQKGKGELLMLALPHHMDIMVSPRLAPFNGSYRCIKGVMTPIRGNLWLMRDNLTTIEWDAPRQVDPERVEAIKESLGRDVIAVPPIAPDPYGFGKALGRQARIALIADAVGDANSRDVALSIVQSALVPWLTGTNDDALVYDTNWGGLVARNGLEDDHDDFGNGYYNDHHFHYGYFIYSAAVAIKHDPSFYHLYKAELDFIVGDVASDLTPNRHFPVARHKDFYDFHSWASGAFSQGNGKSQESVSEAINCYYAVYLFGMATNNTKLADWGRLLTQMEIRAAKMYWQMPVNNSVYDETFSEFRMAGMVGALDVVANTWFGGLPEYVHGINIMPFLPITEELLEPGFVKQEYPVLADALKREDKPADQWAAFAHLDRAVIAPETAWEEIQSIRTFDAGNSLANSLWWIATRPKGLGNNCSDGSDVTSTSSSSSGAAAAPASSEKEGAAADVAGGGVSGDSAAGNAEIGAAAADGKVGEGVDGAAASAATASLVEVPVVAFP